MQKQGGFFKGLKLFGVLMVSYLMAGYFLSGCSALEFRTSREEAEVLFSKQKVKPTFHTYLKNGREIYYVEVGPTEAPMIIFVHGSPGSSDNFYQFLQKEELYQNYRLISVDRPGFGYSGFGYGIAELDKQAEFLAPLLELNLSDIKPVLVGHSLGGPIIAKMAIDYPKKVGALLYLAASVSPELEPANWYRYILKFPVINFLVPTSFVASNTELLPLKRELIKLEDEWPKIKAPTYVIHGSKDKLVPVENADFIKDKTANAPVDVTILDGVNHFLPWNNEQLITEKLLEIMDNLKKH